jgi:two-component system, cell cycle sensor histidine kinase and response regulator CckA
MLAAMSERSARCSVESALAAKLATVDDPTALLVGLFAHSPVAFQIYGADGHSLLVNDAFRELLGSEPPPEYNVLSDDILAREGFSAHVRRAFAGETVHIPPFYYDPRDLEQVQVKEGRRAAVEVTIFPLFDSQQVIRHVALCARDVSSELMLKAASESLGLSEARYRTQFEAAPEAIVTLDTDRGTFVEANRNAELLFGYSREELGALHPLDLSPPVQPDGRPSRDAAMRNIQAALSGEHPTFEWMHKNKAGQEFLCEVRLVRLPGMEANLCRGSIIDISERKRLERTLSQTEDRLRQAQKMEAIGRLAGGIAHDFNNLLSVILGYSSILVEDLKPMDPLRADLEAIRSAGVKASELTRQLLAFSRRQVLAPRVVNLNELVLESERMLRRLLREDIDLVTHCERGSCLVRVDPSQIDQIVMNLAVNARDAMTHGGKLTIETQGVVLERAYASEHPGVNPGRHVVLSVSDTGVGMDRDTQARIFEPFFTTKATGKGTGLGLSTVFGIVQQSGGHIWVYSEPGNGTTFKIYFPEATEDVAPQPQAQTLRPETLHGSETILLVEDQDEVRLVARDILRRYGYNVLEARHAGEALLLCEQHLRTIHMLVTDVVMPQMNGRELAERLILQRPGLRVLYMSGYTEHAIVHHAILDSDVEYLQKPIVPEALARRVREVLDAPSRTERRG